jgi:GTP-binding protein YchF
LKLGIVGLPGSGKTTVFRALTGGVEIHDEKGRREIGLGVVKVTDPRLDFLAEYHKPRKTTPVTVQYSDIHGFGEDQPKGAGASLEKFMAMVRPLDAFVHCVRLFDSPLQGPAEPLRDFKALEEEMILSDLGVVERRLDRVSRDIQRGKKELSKERDLLTKALEVLEQGKPLRCLGADDDLESLRGFSFLSIKPELVLLNVGENQAKRTVEEVMDQISSHTAGQPKVELDWLYADIEAEIAGMPLEDAKEFLQDLALQEGAKERIIRTSFRLLNLIVFFTAGEPEVRAWPLRNGATALQAAGTVHSDMAKGFIRAEVISYDDFRAAGSMAAAHKAGKVRLEGRDYIVRDGDIMLFRFNI